MPGLLKTYDLTDRQVPLKVYGPPGLTELFQVFSPLVGRLGFTLDLIELNRATRSSTTAMRSVPSKPLTRARANSYALVEAERPGASTPRPRRAPASPKAPPTRPCSGARRWRAKPVR